MPGPQETSMLTLTGSEVAVKPAERDFVPLAWPRQGDDGFDAVTCTCQQELWETKWSATVLDLWPQDLPK